MCVGCGDGDDDVEGEEEGGEEGSMHDGRNELHVDVTCVMTCCCDMRAVCVMV